MNWCSGKKTEKKGITIYDIAEEAGVSAATVSRVLNGNVKVSAKTRKKVMDLVEKHNFHPNAMAQGLAVSSSKMLGILTMDIRNPYYAQLVVACEAAAEKAGYMTLLMNSLNDKEEELEMLTRLKEQGVEAIILLGGNMDRVCPDACFVDVVNTVVASVPMVTSGELKNSSVMDVQIDQRQVMRLTMEHLLALGHRRIALIGGDNTVTSTVIKREEYRNILEERGIPYDPELVVEEGSFSAVSGYRDMKKLLEQKVPFTAVIAVNDSTAVGVMRCLTDSGLRIPEDVSLAGADDTYLAAALYMTSVDYNYDSFGELLVQKAISAINGENPVHSDTINPSLVVRNTTSCAKNC